MLRSSTPAFVLTMASYYGTLAATRCLGSHGVPVIMADATRLAAANWSKYVVRRERCPPMRPIDGFIEWLLDFGKRDSGHVLYATCDDLAWAFAERQTELRANFRLLTPSFADVVAILDKGSLYAACEATGIRTPRTWFPMRDDELDPIAREASFPLIVKPRTQVRLATMRKGRVVHSQGELVEAYTHFSETHRHDATLISQRPALGRPMIQEFCADDDDAVYSVSGFADHRHGLFVSRGALKLAQWPRRAGIGIYFADARVDGELARAVQRLCEATRYVGVFEAEFVRVDGVPMLIDFNPRFFGQIGFDVARDLPSPLLAYLAAVGDIDALRAEVDVALRWQAPGPLAFVNRTAIAWTHAAEKLVGWKNGTSLVRDVPTTSDRVADAVVDGNDWLPGVLDSVQQIAGVLLHPRSVLRAAMRGD